MPTLSIPHLLRRSLLHARARALTAFTALTISAAIATALLTLYASLDAKLHHEFRSFGANIVLTAPALPGDALQKAQQAAGPQSTVAAFAYAVATTDRNSPVVIAGVDFPTLRKLDSYWQLPAWPTALNAALLGEKAAGHIADEHAVTLAFNNQKQAFAGAGTLKTGGDEDSRIYLPLPAFEAFTHTQPTVLEIQVPGGTPVVEAALRNLRAAFPQATVTPIRQLVEGESNIIDRTHKLMFAALLLIALTVAVSVLATLSASVLERRRDFALMKALGSPESHLMRLFLLETLALATAGIVAGYLLGSLAAYLISELNFATATYPSITILPIVIAINLIIAAIAALVPTRSLRNLQPAALLKGE